MSKLKALEQVAKIIRAMKGEADDAAVKLGTGKNLEALKKASEDIAEKARISQPPAYPKTMVQDDLAKSQGFKLEGSPYSKEGVIVPEGTGVPAIRTQTLPQKFGSVADDAIETTTTKVDDIPQTLIKPEAKTLAQKINNWRESVDNVLYPGMSEGQKLAIKTTGALATGAGLMSLYGGDDEQTAKQLQQALTPPPKKAIPSISSPEQKKEEKQSGKVLEKKTPNATEEDKDKLLKIGEKLAESPKSVTQEDIDYIKMLKNAQESDTQATFINDLLRAGITIGSSIAGVKPDYSGVEALQKQVGKASQVKELMKTDAAQRELNDEKAMRDPNSEISKQLRSIMAKAGFDFPETVSGKNLKDVGINPYNILTQKMQQDSQERIAKIRADEVAEANTDKQDSKVRNEITSMVNNLSKGKDLERFNNAKEAMDALDLAIETKDKTAIGSAFMKFAKEAQGDISVVRDGDMRILAGGYNFLSPEQMITKLAAKAQGGDFNKTELEQMKRVVQQGIEARKKRLQQQASPIFSRIDKYKMDESIFIDPSLARELRSNTEKSTQQPASEPVTFNKKYTPGSIITLQDGQYVIQKDGVTGVKK